MSPSSLYYLITYQRITKSLWKGVCQQFHEIATPEEIADAIDIPSSVGTALCMAAALKKDHKIAVSGHADITKRNGAYFACFWSRSNCSRCPAWTDALHTASMANDIELVKIILDAGVDVNIRNVQNTIPLHVALARGAKSCVGLLLSSGANYNLQDDEGDNAFHIAADAAK
ncbi:unnamed protein product [Prunus armeniaca]|nr:unnamed protein product [Prunus armeniaca]